MLKIIDTDLVKGHAKLVNAGERFKCKCHLPSNPVLVVVTQLCSTSQSSCLVLALLQELMNAGKYPRPMHAFEARVTNRGRHSFH